MGAFLIDTTNNNLIRENGAFVRLADDDTRLLSQAVNVGLQRFTREDPHALAAGTRWQDLIFVKGTTAAVAETHLRERVRSRPGITSVTSLELTNDPADPRDATVTWTATGSLADYAADVTVGDTVTLTG